MKLSTVVFVEALIRLGKGIISAAERWLDEARQGR